MARPKLGEGETQRLQLKISDEELTAIDDWRFANRVPSRSEAVRRLVQVGARTDERLKGVSAGVFEATKAAIELRRRLSEVQFDGKNVDGYGVEITLVVDSYLEDVTDKIFEANNLLIALLEEVQPIVDAKDLISGVSAANEKKREFEARIKKWRQELRDVRESEAESAVGRRVRETK